MLAGQNIRNKEGSEYLGVSASAQRTVADSSISRIRKTVKMAYALQRSGIHSEALLVNMHIRI